jgi:aspartate oxidase
MKIELIQSIPKQAPSYTQLVVNGYVLGEYIYGKDKVYLDKERWAKKQIAKRVPVLIRNIERLKKELSDFEKELQAITPEKH